MYYQPNLCTPQAERGLEEPFYDSKKKSSSPRAASVCVCAAQIVHPKIDFVGQHIMYLICD
jgi:hypothetical protein